MNSTILRHPVRSDKQGFPLRMFAAAFVISVLTTAITGWQLWQEHSRFEELSRKHIALTEGVGRIMLLDEALTMSARLAAATGDFSYEKTYDQLDPQLSTAINNVRAVLPQPEIEGFVKETDDANLALVKMERKAFALTHQGKRREAITLLTGDEYARFKKVYAEGMQKTIIAKNGLLERDIRHLHMLSLQSAAVTIAGVLVLLAAWFFSARSARSWENERRESESVLREARDALDVRVKQRTADLLDANNQLQHEISEHKQSEAALRESEARYRSLVELSPEAVVVHSEGKVAYINDSGLKIFGASTPGEMIGRPIKDFVHPDYWEKVMNRVRHVQEDHQPAPLQELIFNRLNGQAFDVETAGVPIMLSGKTASLTIIRDITERKQTEEMIRQLAYHDGLTGLPNRKLFSDRLSIILAQARRSRKEVGIAMLDLDKFKDVNDTFGHDVGDLVLKAAAERLTAVLRKGDTVARLGGDEFVLILPDLKGMEDAIQVVQKIVDSFSKPFIIHTRQLILTTSVGISIYPTDGTDEGILLKNADNAMYEAKQSGRDQYKVYEKPERT